MPNPNQPMLTLLAAAAFVGCAADAGLPPQASDENLYGGQPLTGGIVATGGVFAPSTGGVPSGGVLDETGGAIATGGQTAAPGVPCEVAAVLQEHCAKCHGEQTDWGGPMSLTSMADFQAMGKLTTDQQVHSLVKARINDTDRPMPPPTETPMPAEDAVVLNEWLDQGMPMGADACAPTGTGGEMEGTGGTQHEGTQWEGVETDWPGGVVPEETCYKFLKHGQQTPNDETPHITEPGETYINFFYKVPWTEPVVATRWRTIYDNTQVLHHWLLYKSGGAPADGTWSPGLGTHPGAQLMAGWAVGGNDEDFPPGVGLRMPGPGSVFELEWHLFNTTGAPVPDRSGIELCVVPESKVNPKYVAGLTWLGTEQIDLPPKAETKTGGMCTPSFKSGGPIHIVKWLPHMHLLGTHMDTWVLRKDGSEEHVFSEPFTFDRQISYIQNPPVVVNEGDRVFAQCTFANDTSQYVPFGESTETEMCYQFAIAYPAGSLDGGSGITWTGSNNTCISFNTTK